MTRGQEKEDAQPENWLGIVPVSLRRFVDDCAGYFFSATLTTFT